MPVHASEITLTPSGGDDSPQIQTAINTYDTVILSNGTFLINSSLYIRDGTKLKGQGYTQTIFQAVNPSTWYYPGAGLIYIAGKSHVEIANMKIDGGETLSSYRLHTGHDWQNAICLSGTSSDCSFHDLYFSMICNDAVRVADSSSNCEFYNNVINPCGHDALQLWGGENWHIYNNLVNLNINSGFRFANSANCEMDHNTIYCDTGSGFVAVELESEGDGGRVDNIWIHDNYFQHSNNDYNTAIATVHATGSGVDIEYNVFENTNPYSISGVAFTFENNANNISEIPGAGYSSNYEPNILSSILSAPILRASVSQDVSSNPEVILTAPKDPYELNQSSLVAPSQNELFDAALKVIEAVQKLADYTGEIATTLLEMGIVFFFIVFFYKFLGYFL